MDFPDSELETAIAEIEQELEALKSRYAEVCDATTEIQTLSQAQGEIMKQPELIKKQESLKTELSLIINKIQELEIKLESKLFKWQEPFWKMVRYTGVGILLGWLLKSAA